MHQDELEAAQNQLKPLFLRRNGLYLRTQSPYLLDLGGRQIEEREKAIKTFCPV
jgi:hypothetical protein